MIFINNSAGIIRNRALPCNAFQLKNRQERLQPIRHSFRALPKPGDCTYGVPIIVERRIGKVLLEPVIDEGIENCLFLAQSPGSTKMINRDEHADGYTCPPHVACMKSLKCPHILMVPCPWKASEKAAALIHCPVYSRLKDDRHCYHLLARSLPVNSDCNAGVP